ncbi:MAG TPA: ammonium transporter [Candidatus Wunengus sp. YC60]|uniref:ammonium transporter n=1 Tax=Candidatus Wunengus sp. YC60 TaxID=3367697 RepID=UPI00402A3842
MRKGAFVGMSSIFALSMIAIFASSAMAGDAPKIDTGDNAWLLASSALVLIMTPGLALFYGGMVRAKNMVNTLWLSFIVICIISVQWVLWGYSLAFAPGNWFIGGLQWCGLGAGVVGQAPSDLYATTVPHLSFMIFQCMFAVITPALITGTFAERFKFNAWLFFIPLWASAVYAPIAHWVWGSDGWLFKLGALDFAGGTVVHICSGASGLAVILFAGKRKGFPKEIKPPHNLPLMMTGTGLLWFGWFGFNAGSAVAANGLAASAFVVTNTATAAAGFTWTVLEWIHHKKPTLLGACSGAVAGLVAITPASGFVGPMASIAIGVGAGLVCFYSVTKMKKALGYDDALDVIGVHAMGGTWGAWATGIFSSTSVNPAGADGAIYGNIALMGKQWIGILSSWGWSMAVTSLLIWFVKATVGLRPSEAEEIAGMDISQHKEIAYHYYETEQA